MTRKSHLATGVAMSAVIYDSYILCNHFYPSGSFTKFISNVQHFVFASDLNTYVYVAICTALYAFGLVFPDVDIYLPIKHRTWTHCWLPLLICGIMGIWYHMFWFFGFGIFVHMFFDSFSVSGIKWLYPVKTKHFLKIYHTGNPSEYIFGTIILLLSVVYSLYAVHNVYSWL